MFVSANIRFHELYFPVLLVHESTLFYKIDKEIVAFCACPGNNESVHFPAFFFLTGKAKYRKEKCFFLLSHFAHRIRKLLTQHRKRKSDFHLRGRWMLKA